MSTIIRLFDDILVWTFSGFLLGGVSGSIVVPRIPNSSLCLRLIVNFKLYTFSFEATTLRFELCPVSCA